MYNADECFLTGTAAELIPVVKVDGRGIGDGKPGKITQKMMKLFTAWEKEKKVVKNRMKQLRELFQDLNLKKIRPELISIFNNSFEPIIIYLC